MNRHTISVLLALVLAVAVAPTAATASDAYTAGHFMLSLDGEPALFGAVGELTPDALVLRGGTATSALGSWARSDALKDATVVVYDRYDRPVARYYLENAWPSLHDESVAFYYQKISYQY